MQSLHEITTQIHYYEQEAGKNRAQSDDVRAAFHNVQKMMRSAGIAYTAENLAKLGSARYKFADRTEYSADTRAVLNKFDLIFIDIAKSIRAKYESENWNNKTEWNAGEFAAELRRVSEYCKIINRTANNEYVARMISGVMRMEYAAAAGDWVYLPILDVLNA